MEHFDVEKKCKDSYLRICQQVNDLAQAAGHTVNLLAVSKRQPVEKIRWLWDCGQRRFGENYVQEALAKQEQLAGLSIEWHLIGHLQSNKAKIAHKYFHLIESVDSLSLAQKISHLNEASGGRQKVLLEVNLAEESSKTGLSVADLERDWEALVALSGLQIEGLMSLPPLGEKPEESRPYFRKLRTLAENLRCTKVLSMGTSSDFVVAIEEGATEVRIGTLLFGERPQ